MASPDAEVRVVDVPRLVRTALSAARADGLAVLPFCPFVRGYIAGHSEFLDLVPNDMRANFELASDA